MNIIRVTKSSSNRIDAIFSGDKYLFLSPEFGLIAVAERVGVSCDCTTTRFKVEHTMQIKPKVIEKVVTDNERTSIKFKKVKFTYENLEAMQQHTLPYVPNIVLSKVY